MFKKIMAVLLVAILFGGTMFAFAYWDNLAQTEADQTIAVGEGTSVVVVVNASAQAGKSLVPSGVLLDTDEVDSYVFTYDVDLSRILSSDLTLSVTSSNVKIDNSTVNSGLVNVNIAIDDNAINGDDTAIVTVTVTLTEPGTEAVYNQIANKNITFDLTFTAA